MNSLKKFVKNNSKRFYIASMCVLSSSLLHSTYQTSERIKYMEKIREIENMEKIREIEKNENIKHVEK